MEDLEKIKRIEEHLWDCNCSLRTQECAELKSVISSALTSERQRLREEVEKMKIEINEPWDGGYNSALKDILKLLN